MEDILCIGCGAPIQTKHKDKMGYTPQSALEKGLETGELYCQRCFRLRHYNEITDVQLTDDDFLRLLHEVGDSNALVVNVVDIFDFNGSIIPGLPRFVAGNDVLLVGNKKDILPKSVKSNKVTQWLTERAHEEGLRPIDVVLTSAQNKQAIKELIEKIEQYRKGRDVYVVGVTNVGKSTLINAIIQEIPGIRKLLRLHDFQGLHWIRLKFRWLTAVISTTHQGLSTATKWLIICLLKISNISVRKRKSSPKLTNLILNKPSF